ncbi:MAG: protein translocase subunit SecF [Alphaproteobacteria bacterium]|nr:protein translocase subunit SecF [Alphaproteobacteria bacterium]
MALLRLVPTHTTIDFVRQRYVTFIVSGLISLASLVGFCFYGINYGVDFKGGLLVEIRTEQPADINSLRTKLSSLKLGEISLQGFGSDRDVLIRIERQPGTEKAQMVALEKVKAALGTNVSYRRVETVGPKVSEDLKRNALLAIIFSLLGIVVYVWFRFEWQFGICALIALTHDCISILGFYVATGTEFNETAIIAILTTAGYSINDTVVIFDRIRENMRKYKKESLRDLMNRSINDTLSRTTMTSLATLTAVAALYLFGGRVIASFTLPIFFGIVMGTYSSIFLAAPLLLYLGLRRNEEEVRPKTLQKA